MLNKKRKKLNRRPRIEGFVERVIPRYTAQEFKTHFRYVVFIFTTNICCHNHNFDKLITLIKIIIKTL